MMFVHVQLLHPECHKTTMTTRFFFLHLTGGEAFKKHSKAETHSRFIAFERLLSVGILLFTADGSGVGLTG